MPNCIAMPAVGDNVGAVPAVGAAVNDPSVAVSNLLLSTLWATSVAEAEPPLKAMDVPSPIATLFTVGCEPSGPLANPPKVMLGVPANPLFTFLYLSTTVNVSVSLMPTTGAGL